MAIERNQAVISTMPSGLRPLDISNEIIKVRPADSILLTLMMALNKVTVESREFKVNVEDPDASTVVLTGLAGTTCTVADAKPVRVGMNVRKNDTTATRVISVDYTLNTFVIASATGISNGDTLLLGNAAFEENSTRPTPISRVPSQVTNYVETVRDSYGQSRFVETEKYYGPARAQENRKTALWEHKRFIDRGLWFNKKELTTQNGNQLWKTGGFFDQVTTNKAGFSASTVTWNKIRNNMVSHARFMPSGTLWLFVPRKGASLIDQLAFDKHVPIQVSDFFGASVKGFLLGNKRLKMFEVDSFEAAHEDIWALADPAALEIVTCRNQKSGGPQWMLEESDARDPGQDGNVGVITTDFGLRIKSEKRCAVWTGAAGI